MSLAPFDPGAPAIALHEPGGATRWTQGALWSAAGGYAGMLAERSRPGDLVLIVSRTRLEAMALFLGAILAGRLPAFFPPRHPLQDAAHFARQQAESLGRIAPALVVVTEAAARDGLLAGCPDLAPRLLLAPPATTGGDGRAAHAGFAARLAGEHHPEPALFVQHSSGTTGIRKASAVGAAALLAQHETYWRGVVRARLSPEPRVASWLPLYHDMGLLAGFLLPLLDGAPIACADAFDWVATPQLLPDLVEAERATLCWMPNFAYRHHVRLRPFLRRRDLSSVAAWITCSEPCRSRDAQDFEDAFADWGVRPGSVLGAYAMAETVFAATQGVPGQRLSLTAPVSLAPGAMVEEDFLVEGRVTEAPPGTRLVLSSGPAIPGTRVAAYGNGRPLPEGHYGELGIASPSFVGYRDAEAPHMVDGSFATGDLGLVLRGEVFVFGRLKEIIIVGGRNLHAGDIEAAAGAEPGVKPGRAVAFGIENTATGTEDLVILAERDAEADIAPEAVRAALAQRVQSQFLVTPREVLVVDGRWLVKSTSGKISREANRRKYEAMLAGEQA